jgi:FkbH-like protein
MVLRLSRYIHFVPVGPNRILIVDAISHVRLVVDDQLAKFIQNFNSPQYVPPEVEKSELIAALVQRGILTDKSLEEELRHVANLLAPYHGRDPAALLDRFRLQSREGAEAYFSVTEAKTAETIVRQGYEMDLLLFGECDVQMESDFLRAEAGKRGIALSVAAGFPHDIRLAAERKHDAIIIGALRERYSIIESDENPAHKSFIAAAEKLLNNLREQTSKPILIDNLPEPTVQPAGIGERGAGGHRNRFRATNIALSELVEQYPDVHVVDIAGALNAVGAERLIDDWLVHFSHFGSPGWMMQRPESEKSAVHGIFPDPATLMEMVGDNPYLREAVAAKAHIDALVAVTGFDQKKCIIIDLDGVLWPGILAETGKPFAWSEEASGPYSYIGLYFGLHDALLTAKKRGILLVCVSKNDEETVRKLWQYEPHYAAVNLLTPDDFVSLRVNWQSKVENIRSISEELGLALNTFIFIDDSQTERERVRLQLPQVEVWNESPFLLRRRILTDPRLQSPRKITLGDSRTELTRAKLNRQAARDQATDEERFIASLELETAFEILVSAEKIGRVAELFTRTTQFNTTGRKFTPAELESLLLDPAAHICVLHAKDRFGDHGLIGAAVVRNHEISGLVISCRVLGIGIEKKFVQYILAAFSRRSLTGRIVETDRNMPVRNIYKDNGFCFENGLWRIAAHDAA